MFVILNRENVMFVCPYVKDKYNSPCNESILYVLVMSLSLSSFFFLFFLIIDKLNYQHDFVKISIFLFRLGYSKANMSPTEIFSKCPRMTKYWTDSLLLKVF